MALSGTFVAPLAGVDNAGAAGVIVLTFSEMSTVLIIAPDVPCAVTTLTPGATPGDAVRFKLDDPGRVAMVGGVNVPVIPIGKVERSG